MKPRLTGGRDERASTIATIIVADGARSSTIIHLMDGRRKQVLLLVSGLEPRKRGGCRLRG
jgi:hypothetical protein